MDQSKSPQKLEKMHDINNTYTMLVNKLSSLEDTIDLILMGPTSESSEAIEEELDYKFSSVADVIAVLPKKFVGVGDRISAIDEKLQSLLL